MDITVLEIHLPDAEFVAPGGRITGRSDDGDDRDDAGAAPEEGGGSLGGAVLTLLLLGGLALLAWYLRGSPDDGGIEPA